MNISVCLPIALNRSFDYCVAPELEANLTLGLRVKVPFGKAIQTGYITALNTTPKLPKNIKLKNIISVHDNQVFYGKDLFPLANFISRTYANTLGETLGVLIPNIFNRKILDNYKEQAPHNLPLFYPAGTYTKSQEQALKNVEQNQFNLFCGANLSGKTEAALSLAHYTLNNGGQVLILLPDIISSENLLQVINKKIGQNNIDLWHSKVLLSRRKQTAARLLLGKPCLVVGTRSACLLPFKNLKLILMFHEENKDFKQEDSKPYYHTREVVLKRAELTDSKVIFISATPSLEILKLKDDGILKESFFPAPLPQFNTKAQITVLNKAGKGGKLLSDELIQAIRNNMLHNGQSLLILNRLGYSSIYTCLNCGEIAKCKKCGAVLSRIKTDKSDYLICRKCGHKETIEQTCPVCKNQIFHSLGGGTQAAAQEIYKLFPQARVYRLDSQTLQTKKSEGNFAQQAIEQGQADIIIGTNLALNIGINGGHINLAALLNADTEINTDDFRAAERFAQMLFALKSRLCKYKNPQLFIQTSKQDLFDFNILKQDNYFSFAKNEAAFRKDFNFPPYTKLIKLLFTAKTEKNLNTYGSATAQALKDAYGAFITVEGPVKCGMKAKDLRQQYYLIKVNDEAIFTGLLDNLMNNKPPQKLQIKILAAPYNFI